MSMVDKSSLLKAESHFKWYIYRGIYRTYVTNDRLELAYITPSTTAIPNEHMLVADWRLNAQ